MAHTDEVEIPCDEEENHTVAAGNSGYILSEVSHNTTNPKHGSSAYSGTRQRLPSEGSVKKHFRDYCTNTSIHGVKYLGERGRPKKERIWWIFVFALSVAGSAYLIGKVWRKWHEVIVSFAETSTPVWQIPFPTVTICSETKSRQRTFNFTNAMYSSNLTDEEMKKRDDISLICDRRLTINGSKFTNDSTIDTIKEVAPEFDETMWLCRWKMSIVNCSTMFTPVLTDEGICFSFNMLYSTELYRDVVVQHKSDENEDMLKPEWTLEKGYNPSAPLDTEPRRVLGAGASNGITVVLRACQYDMDYLCRGPVQGFKILLHNPAEIPRLSERYFRVPLVHTEAPVPLGLMHNPADTPRLSERYFRVPLDQDLILSVKPNMMSTSEGLLNYDFIDRQCYFTSERYLAYFNVYTQRNCELECLTNYTLKKCQCAAIFMPRLESTPLCGAGSKRCISDVSDDLTMEEIMLSIQKTQKLEKACGCLPECASLQYDAETSQADFNWIKLFGPYKENMSEFEGIQLSRVSISFKDIQFITRRRSEVYGVADFLANCGGLLGLFSGFSVLSLIEIIYYITLRFYTNVRYHKASSEDDNAENICHPDIFRVDSNNETKVAIE